MSVRCSQIPVALSMTRRRRCFHQGGSLRWVEESQLCDIGRGSFVCGLLGSCTLEDNQELSERSQPILLQDYDSACELCFFLQREGN